MKHIVWSIFPSSQAAFDAIHGTTINAPFAGQTVPVVRKSAIVPDNYSNAGATYAATWNGTDPYVILQVGTMALRNMSYLGWPETDKVAWDLAHP